MICPSCGKENRESARFCGNCGETLEQAIEPTVKIPEPQFSTEPSPPEPSFDARSPDVGGEEKQAWDWSAAASEPPSDVPATSSPDTTDVTSKVGLFGGNGLITFGALVVLLGFMLPWASCSGMRLSGLDIVTQTSQYSQYGPSEGARLGLALVPLGALGLLALGVAGVVTNLLGKSALGGLSNLLPFLPLAAILPGLCGCCPSCAFFYNLQNARSDPSGLGMMIQIEYGFWLTLVGLGISFVGIAAALAGGLMGRQKASGIGPPGSR